MIRLCDFFVLETGNNERIVSHCKTPKEAIDGAKLKPCYVAVEVIKTRNYPFQLEGDLGDHDDD